MAVMPMSTYRTLLCVESVVISSRCNPGKGDCTYLMVYTGSSSSGLHAVVKTGD
jgi:hypothetical protein